jgi:hypothetical protein
MPSEFAALELHIERLRRLRWTCDRVAHAAALLDSDGFTHAAVVGLNGLKSLERAEPVHGYEHEVVGDLLHLDVKFQEVVHSA